MNHIRTSALWACLLVASVSFAQEKIYTVRKGDTLDKIAAKVGIPTKKLVSANPSVKEKALQLGAKLTIPIGDRKVATAPATKAGSGGYTVRNGENDWTIAKKFGLSASQLHAMNPGLDWTKLQIGVKLVVPASPHQSASQPVAVKAAGKHTVSAGQNDWIIAKKYGISASALHALNPGVKWSKLQLGQKINVPASRNSGSPAVAVIHSKRVAINGDNVNVRSKPSTSSRQIASVDAGTVASVVDRRGEWYKIRFPSGTSGWVRVGLLTPVKNLTIAKSSSRRSRTVASGSKRSRTVAGKWDSKTLVAGNSVIDTASRYMGVRYRYGASRGSAFDCSGFTSYVYRQHGVSLPRTAAEQSRIGSSVSRGELHAGDLVFFKTRGGSRVSHAGIYVGNGKFIHASSGKGHVTVSSLDEGYYQRRFAGARRVKGAKTVAHKGKIEDPPNEGPAISGDAEPKPEEPKKPTVGADEITR